MQVYVGQHETQHNKKAHTTVGLRDLDEIDESSTGLYNQGEEAQIYLEFLKFLRDKPDELIFNVPHGKIDRLEKWKLKQFLDFNRPQQREQF